MVDIGWIATAAVLGGVVFLVSLGILIWGGGALAAASGTSGGYLIVAGGVLLLLVFLSSFARIYLLGVMSSEQIVNVLAIVNLVTTVATAVSYLLMGIGMLIVADGLPKRSE